MNDQLIESAMTLIDCRGSLKLGSYWERACSVLNINQTCCAEYCNKKRVQIVVSVQIVFPTRRWASPVHSVRQCHSTPLLLILSIEYHKKVLPSPGFSCWLFRLAHFLSGATNTCNFCSVVISIVRVAVFDIVLLIYKQQNNTKSFIISLSMFNHLKVPR